MASPVLATFTGRGMGQIMNASFPSPSGTDDKRSLLSCHSLLNTSWEGRLQGHTGHFQPGIFTLLLAGGPWCSGQASHWATDSTGLAVVTSLLGCGQPAHLSPGLGPSLIRKTTQGGVIWSIAKINDVFSWLQCAWLLTQDNSNGIERASPSVAVYLEWFLVELILWLTGNYHR